MPRPGGEADKLGNHFEAVWTVNAVLDLFDGRYQSICVEALGDESVGVEFHLTTNEGAYQFHSSKRQKTGGDWSIAKLCKKDEGTGRSILGDLIDKRMQWPTAQTCFVSATGANELRELTECAAKATSNAEFRVTLPARLQGQLDSQIIPLCKDDSEFAFAALKTLEVVLHSHADLTRSLERRLDLLFYRIDRSNLRSDDVRRMLAEFVLANLGATIDKVKLDGFFQENAIGVRDWKIDPTVNEAVAAANRRYRSSAEMELINSAHLVRDVVEQIIDVLAETHSRGALLLAPGGFGKSCVLAQCLAQLEISHTPFLCLRMDNFEPCATSKQLGNQMDLPASPAVVLAGIANGAPSMLVVDQLDAMSTVSGRNPLMWQVFSELCDDVRRYPHMKMILACRDFDLEHDHRLRGFGDDKSGFTKFQLERLTDTEVRASVDRAGFPQISLNTQQLEILAIPFHLQLFLQGDALNSFNTIAELYDRYWTRKQQDLKVFLGRAPNWNQVIDALTARMSARQLTFAPMSVTDDWADDARAMASEHVLIKDEKYRRYRFFHESFFDYAFARRFCATERSVVEFLQSSEQHLFRRAQVRQILSYRRENDFTQYIADLRNILASANVRFHIKRMVASGLNRIDKPRPEEWLVIEPYLLAGELSRYVSMALREHLGWFALLDRLHVFATWLAADDAALNNAAIWYLEAPRMHDSYSARVASLIRPYVNRDGDWQLRIRRIMSRGQAHKSAEMILIYLDLIKQGAYDNHESTSSGGDFWSQLYHAEKTAPRFLIDVLATWFDRAVAQFDDDQTHNFLDKCKLNHSHTGAAMIGKAAADVPGYFVEQMLPRLRATVLKTEVSYKDRMLNRAWPWLSNNGQVFDIDDAILLSLRKALQYLAAHDPDTFRRHANTLTGHLHQTFGYLLLRAWADNPQVFANDCAEYFIADQRRLNITYTFTSGSDEGTSDSAISRAALRAISPHCAENLFRQLESRIIGYCRDYEKQTPRRRGYSELLVLRALDCSRISSQAAVRIAELERKFPNVSDAIIKADNTSLVSCAKSPIEQAIAEKMSDEQWISAMEKHDGTTERFEGGGPLELSRLLAELTRKERTRFAALAIRMPNQISAVYFSAILDGLTSRYLNLHNNDKPEEEKQIAAISSETFFGVIDRLHELSKRPCGSAIVACIQRLSDRQLPARIMEIACYYGCHDPDPSADIWQDKVGGHAYHGGDPFAHGINCARGQAAGTLATLLYDDQGRLDLLRPTLLALSQDPIISVRTCALKAFTPLLNFDRDFAVELFLKACDQCEAICATRPFNEFVHYAIHTHYPQLRELLQFALESGSSVAVENAARQIVLAELQDVLVGADATEIHKGSEPMRKAAADVYGINLSHPALGNICAARLEMFFADKSDAVRLEVASAFSKLSGERLLELKDFIARFVESPCFQDDASSLLHALKESNAELPLVICRAAERIIEFWNVPSTQAAHHGGMTSYDISTLVVRQYEQTTDDVVKSRCLALIDQMECAGNFSVSDELAKIDR
jgi:hypothetical protein